MKVILIKLNILYLTIKRYRDLFIHTEWFFKHAHSHFSLLTRWQSVTYYRHPKHIFPCHSKFVYTIVFEKYLINEWSVVLQTFIFRVINHSKLFLKKYLQNSYKWKRGVSNCKTEVCIVTVSSLTVTMKVNYSKIWFWFYDKVYLKFPKIWIWIYPSFEHINRAIVLKKWPCIFKYWCWFI